MEYSNNGRYNQSGRRNTSGQRGSQKVEVDLSCFSKGLREEGQLRAEVLLIDAKKIAKAIGMSQETKSQLRAFFAECKGIEYKMTTPEAFQNNTADIWMLKAKAAYKYRGGASDRKIQNVLHDFLSAGVDYIYEKQSYEAFKDFMKLFEAVVGYSYNENIKE